MQATRCGERLGLAPGSVCRGFAEPRAGEDDGRTHPGATQPLPLPRQCGGGSRKAVAGSMGDTGAALLSSSAPTGCSGLLAASSLMRIRADDAPTCCVVRCPSWEESSITSITITSAGVSPPELPEVLGYDAEGDGCRPIWTSLRGRADSSRSLDREPGSCSPLSTTLSEHCSHGGEAWEGRVHRGLPRVSSNPLAVHDKTARGGGLFRPASVPSRLHAYDAGLLSAWGSLPLPREASLSRVCESDEGDD